MTLYQKIVADLKRQAEYLLWLITSMIKARDSHYTPTTATPVPKTVETTSTVPSVVIEPVRAVLNPSAPYDFSTPHAANHSTRVICDEEGLTVMQKNLICQVIHCESGFNNEITHPNKNAHGLITSTDFYLCQINDYYHIGKDKDFPSVDYVHDNPDKVVRWMIKMFKAGKLNLWVCYSQKLYGSHPSKI
mgnify:FL=1